MIHGLKKKSPAVKVLEFLNEAFSYKFDDKLFYNSTPLPRQTLFFYKMFAFFSRKVTFGPFEYAE